MARLLSLLSVVLAMLAGNHAIAQSFPINVDARPLSAPTISIPGQATFPRSVVQSLLLPAGNYTIGYPGAVGDVSLPFSVTPAGTIAYAPSLSGILLGSGTGTLTVNGVYMIFDNRFTPLLNLALSGHSSVPLPKTFFDGRFIPGVHRLSYAAGGSGAFADFTINATGTCAYAGSLEGVFQGAGTGILRINGAVIQINNTFLSAPDVRISGIYESSPAPRTAFVAAVLPGLYSAWYESSSGTDARADFTVNPGYTVSYNPALQGVLQGAGTGVLTLRGATVAVDNTYLSHPLVNFGGVYDPAPIPASIVNLTLLPGDHDMSYLSTPGGGRASTVATITHAGAVAYAPDQEGVLAGSGSTALTIRGRDLVVDNSYLYATNCEIFGAQPALPNDTSVVTLLPGPHVVRYAASTANPPASAAFETLATGAVTYAPALEGALEGSGTNILRIPGLEFTAALPEWDPGSAFIYTSPTFNSCAPIRLLPGWHTLASASPAPESIEFLVGTPGSLDFDPLFDTDWAGRGTAFLQQRDASGTPALCNQPPIALADPAEITVEATSGLGALVTLDGSASFDPDFDTLTYHWDVSDLSVILTDPASPTPSGYFGVGVTMATLTVTDPSGAYSTADVIIRVVDTTPPSILCSSDRASLWPPNHKMKVVELQVIIDDLAGTALILSATLRSDEPDNAPGGSDGNTTGDTNGADGFAAYVDVTPNFQFDPSRGSSGAWVANVLLRAERQSPGDGRAYTLDVVAVDAAMNISSCSTVIVVPRHYNNGCP